MTTAKRVTGRPWPKGTSGNPRGKPRGARHRVTVALEKLMQADAETILKAVLMLAKNGDLMAARFVLERIVPPARDRAVQLDLPATDTLAGIERAHDVVLDAVSVGSITPAEATSLASLIEGRRRTFEVGELERRIVEIETYNRKEKP